MNPISIFLKLAGRQADIRRAWAIYTTIKKPLTELIDLLRSLMGDIGVLEAAAPSSASPLAKYDTKWVQDSLNIVENAGLHVDGILGPEGSATRKAVAAFQAKHRMNLIDGIPGIVTGGILAEERAKLEK